MTAPVVFELAPEPSVAQDDAQDQQPTPTSQHRQRRCGLCGRFVTEHGRCSMEVPVAGGWMWEHL